MSNLYAKTWAEANGKPLSDAVREEQARDIQHANIQLCRARQREAFPSTQREFRALLRVGYKQDAPVGHKPWTGQIGRPLAQRQLPEPVRPMIVEGNTGIPVKWQRIIRYEFMTEAYMAFREARAGGATYATITQAPGGYNLAYGWGSFTYPAWKQVKIPKSLRARRKKR